MHFKTTFERDYMISGIDSKHNGTKALAATIVTSAAIGSLHGVSKLDRTVSLSAPNFSKRTFVVDSSGTNAIHLQKSPHKLTLYKNIISPVDKYISKGINKFPKGEKVMAYLNKSATPLKQISQKLFIDRTKMLKGAGATAIASTVLFAGAAGIASIIKKHKED